MVAGAAWFLAAAGVVSPASAIELEANPAKLELATGEEVRLLVSAENKGQTEASRLRLSWLKREDLRVTVEAGPSANAVLPAGGAVSWRLAVQRLESGERLTPLLLYLDFTQSTAADKPAVSQQTVTQVEIEAGAASKLTDLAAVELRTGVEVLKDRRKGNTVHLVLTNKSGLPLRVTAIRVHKPYFLCVERLAELPPGETLETACGEKKKGREKLEEEEGEGLGQEQEPSPLFTLTAHSSTVEPYGLLASAVEPGKHALHWEVDFAWSEALRQQGGTLVARQDLQFGVLGESEFVTGVKIPSLFLLPGFLFLLSLGALRKWVHPRADKALELDKIEGLFLAATLSVAATIAYPWVTKRFFGDPRDFLVLAGFTDITNLWIASVALGGAAWTIWYGGGAVVKRAVAQVRELYDRAWMPQPRDAPLKVLTKLRRTGSNELRYDEVGFEWQPGDTRTGLAVHSTDDWVWLTPRIVVEGAAGEILDQVTDLIDGDRLEPLVEFLDRMQGTDARPQVSWDRQEGSITGPLRIARDKVPKAAEGRRRRLVRVR